MTQLTVRMGSEPEAAGRIDDLDGSSAMGVKLLDLFLHIVASKQKKNKLIFVALDTPTIRSWSCPRLRNLFL